MSGWFRRGAWISSVSLSLRRRLLFTSAPSLPPSEAQDLPLYKRLSALGKGSVKLTMNKWLREGNSVRANEVVSYVKRLRKYGRYRHALELMEWMDTRGMNMSYNNYALRMNLICKVHGTESAEKYFNYLPEPAKNRLTYSALMTIYCAEKMSDKATSLFVVLKDLHYDVDTLVYNNLMSLFVKIGCSDKVPALLKEMNEKNVRMDSFTYSTLVTYHATRGDIEAVERTVQQMEADHPSCRRWPAYSNVASVYVSRGCLEKARSSLKKIEDIMRRRDRAAYHHLISLYAHIGDLGEVVRVWTSLKASLWPTNKSYLVFLQALDRLDDLDALEQHFREWDSNCVSYDIFLVNVVIGAYLRKNMIDEARSLLEHATGKGGEADWRTFKHFIDYHVAKGDFESALDYIDTAAAKLKVLKLDKTTVDPILRYLEEKKDLNRARTLTKHLKKLDSVG